MTGAEGRVGSDVQARCGKCGEAWHVVIALAEAHIAQVQCGECGARHRYRPVGGVTAGGNPRPKATRKNGTRAKRPGTAPTVEADLGRPARSFRPSDTYEVGERMVHPTFGEGVVQATRGTTKVEVLFPAGTKLLVQGYGDG